MSAVDAPPAIRALLARSSASATAASARPVRRRRSAFLALYAFLFPGLLSVGGISKFTQSWFPLALVAMAQAILMLTGGISLAIGATGQPRRGDRRDDDGRAARRRRRHRGGGARRPRHRRGLPG